MRVRATGLTTVLAVLPSQAFAEVCDKVRPSYIRAYPNQWDELVAQMTSPFGIVVTLFALPFVIAGLAGRRAWPWAIAGVALSLAALLNVSDVIANDFVRQAALKEGCIGDPTLAIVLQVTAALVCILAFDWKRRRGQ